MYTIYKSNETGVLEEIQQIEKNCWIQCIAPTKKEINELLESCQIPDYFIEDALDLEESARVEHDADSNATLVIQDLPVTVPTESDMFAFKTIPIGIILTNDVILTVCHQAVPSLNNLEKGVHTSMKSRFALQLLLMIASMYVDHLKSLNKQRIRIEKNLKDALTNKELFKLMEIEKSLIYFLTSLKANDVVLKRLLRTQSIKMYEEDKELLEDVLIESQQAIETTELYTNIVESMSSTYSSLISNEMNSVMKTLTLFTIFLTLPTLVFSFFGMNVILPISDRSPIGWIITLGISLLLCIVVAVFLWRKRIFK